jgi:hypothetical protein
LQRLLQKKKRSLKVPRDSITELEEKIVDFSVYLSEIQDEGLRKLLEFLFNYIIAKPKSKPQNRTIVKHFHLEAGNKMLGEDIRKVLYAVRLIMEISADKQSVEKKYEFGAQSPR